MKRYVWIQVTTISWDLCITMEEVHRLDTIHLIYYIMMQHICVTIVTFENYIVCVTILTARIWYSTVAMMHSHNRYIEDGRLSHQFIPHLTAKSDEFSPLSIACRKPLVVSDIARAGTIFFQEKDKYQRNSHNWNIVIYFKNIERFDYLIVDLFFWLINLNNFNWDYFLTAKF